MSTQPRRVSSETPEPDLQIAFPRQRLKLTVNQSGPVLLAGGFGILVLLIFITGLGVASRATLLFNEVSTINTKFRRLSLDLERLRSDMFLAGTYVRDQLFDSESSPVEDRQNQFLNSRSTVEARLNEISENVSPEQRAEFDQLRTEIEEYWKFVEPVFDPDAETRSVRAVRRALASRRDSVL
ncbi:MAG: hypothetical protein DMG15_12335, partial [Acidobacteria bacterium]